MRCAVTFLTVLFLIPGLVRSQDSPPGETVINAVKHATVFVQVQGTDWKGTGSGFVVKTAKDKVYVATNYHVLAGPHAERKTRPSDAVRFARSADIKLVFGSGTKDERTVKADPVAIDPDADLAVVCVTGLSDPPTPINCTTPPKLFETMSVYSFGFPFGKALGVGQASPAVTVGKASVASLRLGGDGELSMIQIDGNLNPGNSGGPVVDAKGQLIGVAVAKVRDGQGIGFAIPAAELSRVMSGRLGRPHLTITPGTEGKVQVKVEVGVIDVDAVIGAVTLHYVVAPAKSAKPGRSELLEKHAAVKRLSLKVEGGVATGELTLNKPVGELLVQAVPDGRDGKGVTLIQSVDVTGPAMLAGGKPPAGWKEHVASDNGLSIWIPDGAVRQAEEQRSAVVRGVRLRSTGLRLDMPGGLVYSVDQVTVPPSMANRLKREDLEEGFRDWVASDFDGKVIDESDVQLGTVEGREYRVESGRRVSRVRLFVVDGRRVVLLQVSGTQTALEGEETLTFMNSCRITTAMAAKAPGVRPRPGIQPPPAALGPATQAGPPPKAEVIAAGPTPRMLGFMIGPEFRELTPEGGLLVGLELGMNVDGSRYLIRSVRAIYRVGDKEVFGQRHGTATGPVATLKARPGYAIGAYTCKSGMAIDGLSVTFVKVKDGKLDPKDAYESDWAGSNLEQQRAMKLDGGGAPAIGLLGKTDDTRHNLVALGTVFRGQERALGPVPPPGTWATMTLGGGHDPEFVEFSPEESVLAGLEVVLGKPADNIVIRSIRPVYRTGDRDEFGDWHGTATDKAVKIVARPGYAVGALLLKPSGTVEGLSVVFMKLADGKLDPNDSYESEWIGNRGFGQPVKLTGDGALVLGLVGRENDINLTGLGLLVRGEGELIRRHHPRATGAPPDFSQAPLIVGGGGAQFRELAPEGGVLVGLEVRLNKDYRRLAVRSIRSIYRVGDKEYFGGHRGTATGELVTLKAKPGYAVGALTAKVFGDFHGLSLTFMKLNDGQLDPKDASESDWVGSNPHMHAQRLDAGGVPVIGLTGFTDQDLKRVQGFGLVFRGQEKTLGAVPPLGTRMTLIAGGANNPEFQDLGPEESLLVGLEIGLGRFFDQDVVIALRPIYRKGDKEEFGKVHGTDSRRPMKVVAKPGYAVGAISVKSGLGLDGLSIKYMRVKDGKLDPTDAYESDWIGGKGGGGPVTLGGDGSLVVGIIGKASPTDVQGIGLLLK